MKWLLGGLVVGAVIAGLLLYRQEHRPTSCDGAAIITSGLGPRGSPLGEHVPEAAAALVLTDESDVESDPDSPSNDDDRVTYYSYGGDRRLDEAVVVERAENGRWFPARETTCE